VFANEEGVYAELFCSLLGKLVRVDTVQAVLVGMGDMLAGESLFFRGEEEEERERGEGGRWVGGERARRFVFPFWLEGGEGREKSRRI